MTNEPQQPSQYPPQIARPMPTTLVSGSDTRALLERDGIPDGLKEELFTWCGDNLPLSNLTVDIINETLMPAFDEIKQIVHMEMGKNITFQTIRHLEELRPSVIMELLRATSTPGVDERERKIIATGYFEQRSQYQEQLGKKGSFFSRSGSK